MSFLKLDSIRRRLDLLAERRPPSQRMTRVEMLREEKRLAALIEQAEAEMLAAGVVPSIPEDVAAELAALETAITRHEEELARETAALEVGPEGPAGRRDPLPGDSP